jgi:hypothetical protein
VSASLSTSELVLLLKRAKFACRDAGFVTSDPEIGSAIGFAVVVALAKWEPSLGKLESFVCGVAKKECLRTVYETWQIHALPFEHHVPKLVACFSDGSRFSCIPWCLVHREAFDRGLVDFDTDHYACDGVPQDSVAVDPSDFDRLKGGLPR